jgi:alkylation response protein AidB-like acyl-CoA dehydrogenase
MDFSFSSDQQLLKNSARAFLDEHCKPEFVRTMFEDPRGESEALWKEMAQLGWLGLAIPEEHGGSGLGMVETAILLDELGRAAYPGPYLPTMLAAHAILAAGSPAQKSRWLPAIAGGSARATVALLERDLDWDPRATATRAERRDGGWTVTGLKQFVPWPSIADVVLVPAQTPEGLSLFLVPTSARRLSVSMMTGMDLTLRVGQVTLDGVRLDADALLGEAAAGPLLDDVLRRGAVAAAAEMLGAARRCLDMAVSYAKVREQFGQPIGSFQAIRHKCAEMLLEVENAHAATYYAAWALDAGAEDAVLAASVAKAYVNDAARKVCSEAIQVHGGIGFTWEYDLHLYFKRAKALEVQYGDADYHRELVLRAAAA